MQRPPAIEALNCPHRIVAPAGDIRLGLLGDTYFGELYAERARAIGRPHPLHDGNYEGSIDTFASFLGGNHVNLANLETPLTRLTVSPHAGSREWLHGPSRDRPWRPWRGRRSAR